MGRGATGTLDPPRATPAAERIAALTDRQKEVACLLAGGLTRAEAAARLSLSEHTIREHLRHIYERTGCHRRSQLVALVVGSGLWTAPEAG